jgi:hypothetical protein
VEATTRASAASVFNILRPFLPSVHSYGDLTNHLLFFLFHMFERFHCWYYDIMVLWYYGIMVLWYYGIMVLWYYGIISIEHRMWKRPPERAQRASLTSSVYSYLRSSYGGRSARGRVLRFLRRPHQPFIILSISHVREILLLVLSVLWYYRYYELVFELYLSNIECGSDHQSERSERL